MSIKILTDVMTLNKQVKLVNKERYTGFPNTCWFLEDSTNCDDSVCTATPSGNVYAVHSSSGACNSAKDRCKDVCLNICSGTCFVQSRCGSSEPYRLATDTDDCTNQEHLGVCGGGGGTPDPKCGTASAACGTGSGDTSACCNPGHHHNHPDDTSEKWLWTCRKTASSSTGEIRCDGDIPTTTTTPPPTCTGTGEYTSQSACEAIDGNDSCVENNGCWVRGTSIDGHCDNQICGGCVNVNSENITCYFDPGPNWYDCQWTCKGINGGNSPGCGNNFSSSCQP